MGRLTSATNPESGIIAYSYDNNGNLAARIDARGVALCFGAWNGSTCDSTNGYNHRNQPLVKQYSDGTPAVSYAYGGCTAGAGRLCTVSNSVSATAYAYDVLGRITGSTQTTAGTAYPFTYAYKLNNALSQITYPSGRVVSYDFDAGGRVQHVHGQASGGPPWMQNYA